MSHKTTICGLPTWILLLGGLWLTPPCQATSDFALISIQALSEASEGINSEGRWFRRFSLASTEAVVGFLEVLPSEPSTGRLHLVSEGCEISSVEGLPAWDSGTEKKVSETILPRSTSNRLMLWIPRPGTCILRAVASDAGQPLGRFELHGQLASASGVVFGEWPIPTAGEDADPTKSEDDEVIEVEPEVLVFPLDQLSATPRGMELSRDNGGNGLYVLRVWGLPR